MWGRKEQHPDYESLKSTLREGMNRLSDLELAFKRHTDDLDDLRSRLRKAVGRFDGLRRGKTDPDPETPDSDLPDINERIRQGTYHP